jgi:hypothetical protein
MTPRPTQVRLRSLLGAARGAAALGIVASLVLAPVPVVAAPPAQPEAAPAAAGGKVALLRLSGADAEGGNEVRLALTEALQEQGYEVKGVARTVEESADKVKCRGKDLGDDCLDRVGQYLDKNAKTEFDFFVFGSIEPADGAASSIVIFDTAKKTRVRSFRFVRGSEDYILPLSLPRAIARGLVEHQRPPGPLSPDEEAVMASLDEPTKTQEELAAEQKKLAEAERARLAAFDQDRLQQKKSIDLRAEFAQVCRKGPREDQVVEAEDGSETKVRDLRPSCKRGPVWGYWQPRAYVALVLASGAAVTTGLFYGLALGAHLDWKKAKDELDASGLSSSDPANVCNAEGVCYADLAGKASEEGFRVRRNAILGDVFLGTTVLLTGMLAIIISQDRSAAKDYLIQQKDLAQLRIGPMLGKGSYGASAGFRF